MSIHPTAMVSESARLGAGVRVGPYAVIEQDTNIGEGTEIRAHAVIKRYTTLGEASVIHEGAVIGGEPQDLSFMECESYLLHRRAMFDTRRRDPASRHRAGFDYDSRLGLLRHGLRARSAQLPFG